jgi:hypothetical protein
MEASVEKIYQDWCAQNNFTVDSNIADYAQFLTIDILKYAVEEQKLNILIPNKDNKTLLSEAERLGKSDIVQYLSQNQGPIASAVSNDAINLKKTFVAGWF